jgi:hypothetical protein
MSKFETWFETEIGRRWESLSPMELAQLAWEAALSSLGSRVDAGEPVAWLNHRACMEPFLDFAASAGTLWSEPLYRHPASPKGKSGSDALDGAALFALARKCAGSSHTLNCLTLNAADFDKLAAAISSKERS